MARTSLGAPTLLALGRSRAPGHVPGVTPRNGTRACDRISHIHDAVDLGPASAHSPVRTAACRSHRRPRWPPILDGQNVHDLGHSGGSTFGDVDAPDPGVRARRPRGRGKHARAPLSRHPGPGSRRGKGPRSAAILAAPVRHAAMVVVDHAGGPRGRGRLLRRRGGRRLVVLAGPRSARGLLRPRLPGRRGSDRRAARSAGPRAEGRPHERGHRPGPRRRVGRAGHPRARPARVRDARRTSRAKCILRTPGNRLPRGHGPRRHLVARARAARRARDGRRGPGRRRRRYPRTHDQHPAPPALGPRPGDLRRGPPAHGRPRRGLHPGGAGARAGQRQALRPELDREHPLPGERHGRRAVPARDLSAALPPRRPGGGSGLDHERVQPRERALLQ